MQSLASRMRLAPSLQQSSASLSSLGNAEDLMEEMIEMTELPTIDIRKPSSHSLLSSVFGGGGGGRVSEGQIDRLNNRNKSTVSIIGTIEKDEGFDNTAFTNEG